MDHKDRKVIKEYLEKREDKDRLVFKVLGEKKEFQVREVDKE